jgi:hypothetical protein
MLEIKISAKENAVNHIADESLLQEEKKKVAPKRNESSAKLKDTLTSLSIEADRQKKGINLTCFSKTHPMQTRQFL